jgi:hypothetical protein
VLRTVLTMENTSEPGPPGPWHHEPPPSQPTNITPSNPFDPYNSSSATSPPLDLPFATTMCGPPSGLPSSEASITLELRQQVHHLSALMERLPEHLRTLIPTDAVHNGFPPSRHTKPTYIAPTYPAPQAPPDLFDMPHATTSTHTPKSFALPPATTTMAFPIGNAQPSLILPDVPTRVPGRQVETPKCSPTKHWSSPPVMPITQSRRGGSARASYRLSLIFQRNRNHETLPPPTIFTVTLGTSRVPSNPAGPDITYVYQQGHSGADRATFVPTRWPRRLPVCIQHLSWYFYSRTSGLRGRICHWRLRLKEGLACPFYSGRRSALQRLWKSVLRYWEGTRNTSCLLFCISGSPQQGVAQTRDLHPGWLPLSNSQWRSP